ncbi:ThiF family adenylyltransferase [Isachenkonia alkalipeptolytica]|uniref:THIF-type NAD/FAD binding fold domain-containing protein n=1 Tax=Isachenkonia alkalipeptolytica TaxID=2565777 RepID=A0AA43XLK4_9CLOT|nr:ThiF family adenylyltransferase [Isachenkonia alkalipeptolytica]NBG88489.1 hypothetical protein [Isachenkonia alkalipeptolytica]
MFERYEKQMNYEKIGRKGQERLQKSKVLIIGCGALGTVVANNLVRMGIGHVRIVDRDYVELTNLHRQILFDEEDLKKEMPKAKAAEMKLQKINSEVTVEGIVKEVNSRTIEDFIEGVDCIVDCTDNFKTRFLINDVAFKNDLPWIYGGALGTSGMVKAFLPEENWGCLQCMIPKPPDSGSLPTCDTAGVVNTLTGVVASMESNETLKLLLGSIKEVEKDLLFIDLWDNTFKKIPQQKNDSCTCCVKKEYIYLDNKKPEATYICGQNSIQINLGQDNMNLKEIQQRLENKNITTRRNPYLLSFEADGVEVKVFKDGRAILKNAKNEETAKSIYAKYIGY